MRAALPGRVVVARCVMVVVVAVSWLSVVQAQWRAGEGSVVEQPQLDKASDQGDTAAGASSILPSAECLVLEECRSCPRAEWFSTICIPTGNKEFVDCLDPRAPRITDGDSADEKRSPGRQRLWRSCNLSGELLRFGIFQAAIAAVLFVSLRALVAKKLSVSQAHYQRLTAIHNPLGSGSV